MIRRLDGVFCPRSIGTAGLRRSPGDCIRANGAGICVFRTVAAPVAADAGKRLASRQCESLQRCLDTPRSRAADYGAPAHPHTVKDHPRLEWLRLGQQSGRPHSLWRWPRQLFRQRRLSLAFEHAAMGARVVAQRNLSTTPLPDTQAIDGVDDAPSLRTYLRQQHLPAARRPLPDLGWGRLRRWRPYLRVPRPTPQRRGRRDRTCSIPTGRWQQGGRDDGLARHARRRRIRKSQAARCGKTATSRCILPDRPMPCPTSMAAPIT